MRIGLCIGCLLVLSAGVCAAEQDGSLSIREQAALKQPILALYQQYAQALRAQGTQKLKKLTTADFMLKGSEEKFKGAEAVAELDKYRSGLQNEGVIKIRIRHVQNTGVALVIYTQETVQETREVNKVQVTSSSDWDWKQTWRKTPQGWKLALDEQLSEQDAKKIKEDNPVWTISSRPDAAPSSAVLK